MDFLSTSSPLSVLRTRSYWIFVVNASMFMSSLLHITGIRYVEGFEALESFYNSLVIVISLFNGSATMNDCGLYFSNYIINDSCLAGLYPESFCTIVTGFTMLYNLYVMIVSEHNILLPEEIKAKYRIHFPTIWDVFRPGFVK